jgi:hypothetical protein
MRLFLAIVAIVFTTLAAYAETANPLTNQVFPRGKPACFTYNPESSEPGRLSYFALFKLLEPDPTSELIGGGSEAEIAKDKAGSDRIMQVLARVKGEQPTYRQEVLCRDIRGELLCGVECDGGNFKVARKGKNLAAGFDKRGMVVTGGCGEGLDRDRMIGSAEAPGGITLVPTPIAACRAARERAMSRILKQSVPLRTRIAEGKWQCLSRTYTAEELAAEPGQTIKRLTVAILAAPARHKVDADYYETRMEVALKVTQKNGKTGEAKENCVANSDYFVCGEAFRLRRRDETTALLQLGGFAVSAGDPLPKTLAGLRIGKSDQRLRLNGSAAACE